LEYFDYIVSNEDVENPKPDPEGYVKVMQRFDVGRRETLIVEDSDVGWQAAMGAGANVLRVANAREVTLKHLDEQLALL
jgi:HAD superfamily hydrolase (TIGR01509 family)